MARSNSGATPEGITPIHEGVDHAEPCVAVSKMREFGDNERFDQWCIKHHHWLNDAPAKRLSETL